MTKLTDQEFKNEFLEFRDEVLEFKEQTLTRLTALEVKVERIPQIENKVSELNKNVSKIEVTQAKILGILEGRESATSRTRANIALWIAAGVALFGEAGSKILSLFR